MDNVEEMCEVLKEAREGKMENDKAAEFSLNPENRY